MFFLVPLLPLISAKLSIHLGARSHHKSLHFCFFSLETGTHVAPVVFKYVDQDDLGLLILLLLLKG